MRCFFLGHEWVHRKTLIIHGVLGDEKIEIPIPMYQCARCKKTRRPKAPKDAPIGIHFEKY